MAASESEVAQSCPTLSYPHGLQPTRPSIHGIFQARVLEWGAIAFSVNSGLGILYLLGAGILGDSLSALGHGVLGQLPR